jgi:Coenzyme PQQ synthesis protein D (PqqD)
LPDKRGKMMQIERGPFNALEENQLPDGSRFLVDRQSETVYALNATAGAAWDACSAPTTLQDATKEMQRSFDPDVTEDVVGQAFLELQQRNLVTVPANAQAKTRREVLSTLGKVALPLVVAMTLTEQRAHATVARSYINRTPQPDPVLRGHTPHCGIIQKFFGGC